MMMEHPDRADALAVLHRMQAQVRAAEAELMRGEAIPALRALLSASRLGRRASVALAGGCLRQQINEAASPEVDKREKGLQSFIKLANFVFSAFCQSCRQKVSRRLKKE